jgi:hypothetical protein
VRQILGNFNPETEKQLVEGFKLVNYGTLNRSNKQKVASILDLIQA